MRQIHICAWLLVMSLPAACSGEKFTTGDSSSATSDTPTAGTASRNHAGSSSTTGTGGSTHVGAGATPSGAGTSTSTAGASGSKTVGGTPNAGGRSGVGGTDNAGGDAADACPSGSITFRMLPGPDLGHDYLCDAGCGTGWLTITDAQGAMAFSIFPACGAASCESCQMTPCMAAACLPTPLTGSGSELVWTGTYLAKDTCGSNIACQRQACVKPGKYKAKACAAINAGPSATGVACTPKNEQLCTDVEFEFPATTTVDLVLKK